MATPLNYAQGQPRRGAPWWLWTLASLSVLGLLSVGVPFATRSNPQTRRAAARADVANLKVALDAFAQDAGRYPTSLEGVGALTDPPACLDGWDGPYIKGRASPTDPWGQPYVYGLGPGSTSPHVVSLGPDGKRGTADDIVSP